MFHTLFRVGNDETYMAVHPDTETSLHFSSEHWELVLLLCHVTTKNVIIDTSFYGNSSVQAKSQLLRITSKHFFKNNRLYSLTFTPAKS